VTAPGEGGSDVYQQDYILRLIEQVGAVLRAMLNTMREQRPEEALAVSREALGTLTGLPDALAESLTAEGLLSLLSAGGTLEARRTLLVAEVLVRRGEALDMAGEEEAAARERRKALALLVAVRDAGLDEDAAAAEALMTQLE
jgi:hypothetical protein